MRLSIERVGLLAGAAVLLLAAAPHKPRVAFSAPAAYEPAGRLSEPFAAVLPSGRFVRPAGKSLALGERPLALALARQGTLAVVAGSGRNGGPGLEVVDLATMQVVAQHGVTLPPAAQAVAVLRDGARSDRELVVAAVVGQPQLAVYDIAADGTLSADAMPSIVLPNQPQGASALVVAPGAARLYAVGAGGAQAVDVSARAAIGTAAPVGHDPAGATRTGTMLAIVNQGTPDANHAYDLNASSISLVETAGAWPANAGQIPLDGVLDPVVKVGGVQPSAVSAAANGTLFVALANADRVDVFQRRGRPPRYHRVAVIDLSLYRQAPFGTAPDALTIAPGGRRLYAALAGIDAVAVVDVADPRHPRRLGLLPSGWFPSALSFSRPQGALVVANALGDGDSGTLQLVPLSSVALSSATMAALRAVRTERPIGERDPVVPQAPALGKSRYIDHVVSIEIDPSTYDLTLGDLTDAAGQAVGAKELGGAVGDPALALHGTAVTPNLHVLARRYAVAANFFAPGRLPELGDAVALGGVVTVATARRALAQGQAGTLSRGDFPRFGFLYNNLARHRLSFRDYGNATWLTILDGNEDPGFAAARDDASRAEAFIADYGARAANGQAPVFASVLLSGGSSPVQDRAVGAIVAALSRGPTWSTTLVIVAPRGVAGKDHVDPRRSYALLIGPNVKQHYVGRLHLSYASLLKTEEEILGLPALSLGDLLSSDLAEFFTTAVDATPFVATDGSDGGAGQGSVAALP
ncbi:hypothetical protein EPN44_04485 [bacterium]|nr:MAG: hypothetical protein EPN44_04485 [bacterium]